MADHSFGDEKWMVFLFRKNSKKIFFRVPFEQKCGLILNFFFSLDMIFQFLLFTIIVGIVGFTKS